MHFRIIYADPPWTYRNYGSKVPGVMTPPSRKRGASRNYPCMTTEQICSLQVEDLAEKNAVLFLWVTWPMLEHGLKVIRSWGFEYRTLGFEWFKTNKDGTFYKGMGNYGRQNSEPCLLGVRGSMPVYSHRESTIVTGRIPIHSRKPEKGYELIEKLYPEGPHLELFATTRRPGWSAWGNQFEPDIELKTNEIHIQVAYNGPS